MEAHTNNNHYLRLLIMAVLSFIAMYVLMYAMVNTFSNVLPNLNQFYMAGLMAAPMMGIEVLLMRGMYRNTKLNIAIKKLCKGIIAGQQKEIGQMKAKLESLE